MINEKVQQAGAIRFRNIYMFVGGILVLFLYFVTDPNAHLIQNLPFGASTIVLLSQLLKAIWFVGMLHMSRRGLFDYLDLSAVIKNACQTPEGAGRVFVGMGLVMVAIAICIAAAVVSN